MAGVAEHSLMFPVDTVKTIMQVRHIQGGQHLVASTQFASPIVTLGRIWEAHGALRLWRGVQTMFTGCIPAHGAYFTIYESAKPAFTRWLTARAQRRDPQAAQTSRTAAMGAGAAVALGTMAHDIIMTPMDVCKQRLQLGHHKNSVFDCACDILRKEGVRAFLLSYPTTLLMNVPYALVMGSANEKLRDVINPRGVHSVSSYLAAGAGAGAIAAAVTNPMDVVKTRLQTQHCGVASACDGPLVVVCPKKPLAYRGLLHAVSAILAEEGVRGFVRGMSARVCIHAPSVAICWTTYESIKHTLERLGYF